MSDLNDLFSEEATVKYTASRWALQLAESDPARLYPDFDFFVNLLDHKNKIMRWTAIGVIGYLAQADQYNKVEKIKNRLYAFLNRGNMITANNTIKALGIIAVSKPDLREEITREILKIEHYNYETEECRNITIGTAIKVLGNPVFKDQKGLVDFVKRNSDNRRSATRKKAAAFLRSLH